MSKSKGAPFPTREQIADFIRSSQTPVTKREIARAFHITGDRRIELKAIIRDLEREGLLSRGRGRKVAPPDALPAVAVIQVVRVDTDGEVEAAPFNWAADSPAPRIFLSSDHVSGQALAAGDRVLARLARLDEKTYEARAIRRLERRTAVRIVGTFRERRGGGVVIPADRRQRDPIPVDEANRSGAADGELVLISLDGDPSRLGPRQARIVDRLGDPDDPRSISLVAIASAGLPTIFPQTALEEAEAAGPCPLGSRTDLRAVPLVTIDGADARDFDDAVWAEADKSPENPGGWRMLVAIADVTHYVPTDCALDREAYRRGNSCYFPDRVVPMLPEALSNGLCSLKPGEDRACVAVEMAVDRDGNPLRHRFLRGLMRSAARLTYEQVQAARDGAPDALTAPLMDTVIGPLYGAFGALVRAREARGTLDLDIAETKIELDDDGRVSGIGSRMRLDSHRLIEEFMIAANVAAAATLLDHQAPSLYRVHAEPDKAKVEALREVLEPLGYSLAKGAVLKPRLFTHILERAAGRPEAPMISELILRSQAQAVYSPENIGHFGLALPRYTHFTSPIRRYSDLLVHRALIRLLKLGTDGATDAELLRLEETGRHVSYTERRAIAAERDAVDRFTASFLASRVGSAASGRIVGVTRFGLFVRLDEIGADGLVPVSTLPDDRYIHDAQAHALVGDRWQRCFRLGAQVRVTIAEADALSGSTVFRLIDADDGAEASWLPPPKPAGRSRPVQRGAGRRRRTTGR